MYLYKKLKVNAEIKLTHKNLVNEKRKRNNTLKLNTY